MEGRHSAKLPASKTNGLQRGKGFSRGAVLRLRLENFLTFDRTVINLQPQLNVIAAPNGTGKSSIVCAICLSLGGSTTLLGRAKELKDYVKHGKETGFVEITLCDHKASTHPVIRRTISASSNSSEWTINRRSSQEKDVKKLVSSLNIQLDNHCMFLPQDKVIEFARMNKQELLLETERAVGPEELCQYHDQLKTLKKRHSQTQENLKKIEKKLEDLKRENNLLQRDVERFRNKEKFEKDIKHLTYKRYWLQYQIARNELSDKKKELKKVKDDFKSITDHYRPIEDRGKVQEAKVRKCKDAAQTAMAAVRRAEKQLRDEKERLTGLEDSVYAPRQELDNTKKEEESHKRKIENLKREIEGFKKDLDKLESTESLNPKIAEKNTQIRNVQQDIEGIGEEQREILEERQKLEDVVRQDEDELQQMNNVWTQRLQKLEDRRESATVKVIKWLKGNQRMFQRPILEPVCVTLNVLDKAYVNQVESFFSGRDFLSFVAQNEEDKERFLREVRDTLHLKVNIVRAPAHPLSDYMPNIPFNRLKRYGFLKMLLDVVEAPEPVLCFFCQYHGLQHVPIAGRMGPDHVSKIINDMPDLRSFFTADMKYLVTRSQYRNSTSIRTPELYPARFFMASVDTQRKEALEERIQLAKTECVQFEQHYEELATRDSQLRREDAKLRNEKNELRKIMDTRKAHRTNITSREKKLEQSLKVKFDIPEAELKCEREVNRIQTERVTCLANLKQVVISTIAKTDGSIKATLNVSTAEAREAFFLRQFRQAKTARDEAELKVRTLTPEVNTAKEKARLLLERAQRETGMESPDSNGIFAMFPDSLDEIDDKIHELKAEAELCMGTNQSVVNEYKERQREISLLTEQTTNSNNAIENDDKQIKDLKQKWLEPLMEVIGRVNACFGNYFSSHMGMESAGEVLLDPDPGLQPDFCEFDKFGVQIRVKFRDVEQLQDLNAQRQSGGERSVSTMLFLLALQGSTACPFRVVDEINQGMDPVNERHIFNLIVQSACNGAQYLLLTPKLLQNLEYSQAVAVHMVNNGQEMVTCDKWDLNKMLC